MRPLFSLLLLAPTAAFASHPSTCPSAETILGDLTCSTSMTGSMIAGTSDLGSYTAPCSTLTQPGPDHVYEFECTTSGTTKITMTPTSCDLDLYVVDDTCTPAGGCLASSTFASTTADKVTFTCTAGDWYYVVVEGYSFGSGTCTGSGYTLAVDRTSASCLEDCDDGIDNDSDGDYDCDDSDCASDPICDCDRDFDGHDLISTLCGGDDCDDADDTIYPGATEVCDGIDQDCDTVIDDGVTGTYYKDVDRDGYGGRLTTKACSTPTGYVGNSLDCDDSDSSTHPGGTEVCDSADNNCDGSIDEGVTTTYYADADGDGYGGSITTSACTLPTGYVTDSTDCDDTSSSSHPGASEVCDYADNDCDLSVDEGVLKTYYKDADSDGYGDSSTTTTGCSAPTGYVTNKSDCDDADATIKPGAAEICDDIDNDCDSRTDEGIATKTYYADTDEDGYGNAKSTKVKCNQPDGYVTDKTDCDDTDDTIYPGAAETAYDSVDQDCSGKDLLDLDADGYDYDAFGGTDCIDDDATVHPGVAESSDGIDEDCDGKVDEGTSVYDDDGDGYTEDGGDCNDASKTVHPGVAETCDSVDSDCNGAVDDATACFDDDGDGFAEDEGDCDDASTSVSPGLTQVADNGVDDDCDGGTDFGIDDHDDDGYTGSDGADCDDEDETVFPGADELPDTLDNDCDGVIDEGTDAFDDDGDGESEEEGDCNDGDAGISTTGIEADNGADDDCDGLVDEGGPRTDDDLDGFSEEGGDCDDEDAAVHPGAAEAPNTLDDDCDGVADEGIVDADLDGYTIEQGDCDDTTGWRSPGIGEMCDGIDNNCDDVVDEGVCVLITEDTDPPDTDIEEGGKKCGTTPGAAALLPALLGLLMVRRRR